MWLPASIMRLDHAGDHRRIGLDVVAASLQAGEQRSLQFRHLPEVDQHLSDAEPLCRVAAGRRLDETVDLACLQSADELRGATQGQAFQVAAGVQPAVFHVPARKRFVGPADGAIADLHSLELGEALFGRRLEVDTALLDEGVRRHEIERQRMHEGQDADLASAVRDLEILVRVGRQELGIAGQQRGVGRRAATKHRKVHVEPMLLEDSGIAGVVQRHRHRCENGQGDGDLGQLLGFSPRRPGGQCCKCHENRAARAHSDRSRCISSNPPVVLLSAMRHAAMRMDRPSQLPSRPEPISGSQRSTRRSAMPIAVVRTNTSATIRMTPTQMPLMLKAPDALRM